MNVETKELNKKELLTSFDNTTSELLQRFHHLMKKNLILYLLKEAGQPGR